MLLRRVTLAAAAASVHFALAAPAAAGPALLYDAASERVLYAEDAGAPWYPASLTKMMTAYIVFEAFKARDVNPGDKLVISAYANTQPRMRLGLGAGKELSYESAVTALVMRSANDVAVAIAEGISGSEDAFVQRMNATAVKLGMFSTRFINPHGLPGPGQQTTAKDLAKLARALARDYPEHMGVFALQAAQVGKKAIATHNAILVSFDGGDGIKTGFTCSAGYNIVASATRDGRQLIAIVLGEASKGKRTQRTMALLEHGFRTRDWKSQFPAPSIDGVPEGDFDRVATRAANLEQRLKDCTSPEPEPLVAETTAQPAAAGSEAPPEPARPPNKPQFMTAGAAGAAKPLLPKPVAAAVGDATSGGAAKPTKDAKPKKELPPKQGLAAIEPTSARADPPPVTPPAAKPKPKPTRAEVSPAAPAAAPLTPATSPVAPANPAVKASKPPAGKAAAAAKRKGKRGEPKPGEDLFYDLFGQ